MRADRLAEAALRLSFALLALTALCGLALGYLSLRQPAVAPPLMATQIHDAVSIRDGAGMVARVALPVERHDEPVLAAIGLFQGALADLKVEAALGVFLATVTAMGIVLFALQRRISALASASPTAAAPPAASPPFVVAAPVVPSPSHVPIAAPDAWPLEASALEPPDLATELQALGAEIRRRVGELSHEMRTPLAVIAGSVNGVHRALPQEADRGRRSADLIALSCDRLVDILDLHRDQTAQLLDSFIGSQTAIDVGAFVQDVVARAGNAGALAVSHPPQALYARTQPGALKEILRHLLVVPAAIQQGISAGPNEGGRDLLATRISLHQAGAWIRIVIVYGVVPAGVEYALRGHRLRLSLMGATLHSTRDDQGNVMVVLALPAETATGQPAP